MCLLKTVPSPQGRLFRLVAHLPQVLHKRPRWHAWKRLGLVDDVRRDLLVLERLADPDVFVPVFAIVIAWGVVVTELANDDRVGEQVSRWRRGVKGNVAALTWRGCAVGLRCREWAAQRAPRENLVDFASEYA